MDEMTDKELVAITIDRYTDLQRVKKANNNHENAELYFSYIMITALKANKLPKT